MRAPRQALTAAATTAAAVAADRSAPPTSGTGPRYPRNHPLAQPPRIHSSLSESDGADDEAAKWERWEAWAGEIADAAGAANGARRGGGSGGGGRWRKPRGRGHRRVQGDEDIPEGGGDVDPAVSPSQRLRDDLLANYDRGTFPWEAAWESNAEADEANGEASRAAQRRGLEIEVGINFHRVFEVDVERSTAALVVWLRQRWVDPRLAWNPSDYGNITSANFWVGQGSGPGGETSEIWTPDLELWNLEVGLAESLADAPALVDSTGVVFWSRPGHLQPVCKFRGLDDFPFDELGCTVEIGSWSHSGLYVRPVLMGDGYSVGGSETAGEAFAEFHLGDVNAREHLYPPYPAAPEEDWPVVMYDVAFLRSWQPYVRGYLILQIILNLTAFACFWLPPQCGERIGLAITSLLAAVTSDLVVSSSLPSASELTWFAKFSLMSLAFSAMALFESAVIIYFFYKTSDDLVPNWAKWLHTRWVDWRGDSESLEGSERDEHSVDHQKSSGSTERAGALGVINEKSSSEDSWIEDDRRLTPNDTGGSSETFPSVRVDIGVANGNEEDRTKDDIDKTLRISNTSSCGSLESSPRRLGSEIRRRIIKSAPPSLGRKKRPQEPLTSSDPTHNCRSPSFRQDRFNLAQWGSGQHSFARDADDYRSVGEARNNQKWQKVAKSIDDGSRVIFPLAYAIALGVLLGPNKVGHAE